jgi:5-methylthioadenosine/S-adenosylhomocysteine deaminase
MKLATNRAMPYPGLRAAGANSCLGTDGCASNNNLDMFEEMKIAAILQKFFWNDPTILPAPEALAMASANGAKALGLPTGRLAPGTPADIILVSNRDACNVPLHNATSNLVYATNGGSVETTICNGRVLMLDRGIPDEAAVLNGAADAAFRLVQRAQSG